MKLFTIGYEKRDFAEFLDLISRNRIEMLIDIRANPHSRRVEYSKKNLAEKLPGAGIEYVQLRELGTPKELRDKVKADGDYDYFFKKYAGYLEKQTDALSTLLSLAGRKTVCLLCYERDANRCHRRAVAARIEKMSAEVVEISNL